MSDNDIIERRLSFPDEPNFMFQRAISSEPLLSTSPASTISGLITRTLLVAMEQLGVDTVALCRTHEMDHEKLMDPAARLPRGVVWKLFNEGARINGDPSFGFSIAQSEQTRLAGGLLRQMADVSETAEDALTRLIKFHKLLADGLVVRLHTNETTVEVELIPAEEDVQLIRHALEFLLAGIWRAVTDSITEQFVPLAVTFPHAAPPDILPYVSFFGCEVEFGGDSYKFVFPAAPLRQEMIGAQRTVAARLDELGETQLSDIESNLVGAVAEQIRIAMRNRQRPSRKLVAKRLALGQRTLVRRLKDENSSFRAVFDQTRANLAITRLREGMRISDVAQSVGFGDAASFARAFRRWTGKSPSNYR